MRSKFVQRPTSAIEVVGLQTLLIGLEATLERHVESVNDTREQLNLPPISILRGVSVQHHPAARDEVIEAQPRQLTASPHKAARPGVAAQWKQRLAVIDAAGMRPKLKGMPSNALVEKAERKLKRLGIPIPGAETPEKKSRYSPRASARMKKLVGASSKARWDLAHRAGLKPTKLPSNKMLAKARRILGLPPVEDKKRKKNTTTSKTSISREAATPRKAVTQKRSLSGEAQTAVAAAVEDMTTTHGHVIHETLEA